MATRKEKIAFYLIDHINLDNYKDCDWVRKDNEVMAIRDIVKVEKKDEWNDRNPVPAVESWLRGVPSAFECSHSTFRQAQLLHEWTSMGKKMLDRENGEFIADVYYTRLAIEFVDYSKRYDWGKIVAPPMKKAEREALEKERAEKKKLKGNPKYKKFSKKKKGEKKNEVQNKTVNEGDSVG